MNSSLLKITLITLSSISLISCSRNFEQEYISGSEIDLEELSKIAAQNFTLPDSLNPKLDQESPDSDDTPIVPSTRDELGNLKVVVSIYDGESSQGLSIPGFGGIQLGEDESNLNLYYVETELVENAGDTTVYGIGYSVHYLFKKVKRGLSILDLPIIAASAQIERNKTQVYYSMQTYGIRSLGLVRYFKPTVNQNFDVEGYGIMQSSIDGIHNILSDTTLSKSVIFTPRALPFINPSQIKNASNF